MKKKTDPKAPAGSDKKMNRTMTTKDLQDELKNAKKI